MRSGLEVNTTKGFGDKVHLMQYYHSSMDYFVSLGILDMEYLHDPWLHLNLQNINIKKGLTYNILGKWW